jgi:pyruvate/2-oxoglutarate dehydrogenase complex dihydrolipoamide acyltransferase (E2) component
MTAATGIRARRGRPARGRVSDDPAMADADTHEVRAPFAGVVVAIAHERDEAVGAGSALVVLEAMKMEHEVLADSDGVVQGVAVVIGEAVQEGQLLVTLASSTEGEPSAGTGPSVMPAREQTAGGERADLRVVRERHEIGLDAARPEAVAQRRERGRRTARENLADLLDADTFVEYGPLLFAAQ